MEQEKTNKICTICGATETFHWYYEKLGKLTCRNCYETSESRIESRKKWVESQNLTCSNCTATTTIKWYFAKTNPICRNCYEKTPHRLKSRRKVQAKYKNNYPEKAKESDKNSKIKHKEKNKIKKRKHDKYRRKTDSLYSFKKNISSATRRALKNYVKDQRSLELLGCPPEQARQHLESQFLPGMTWDNHGNYSNIKKTWHIDHIIPLSSAKTEEEAEKLCHYTNLQPLWAIDNLIKGNRTPEELEAYLNKSKSYPTSTIPQIKRGI